MTDFGFRGRGNGSLGASAALLRAAVLGVALGGSAPALLACSSDETADDGGLRGTLMVYVATLDDGTNRTEYGLFVGGGESDVRTLVFRSPPELESGSEIEVWGEANERELVVDRFELVGAGAPNGLGSSREPIIDGTPYATRTFAYVLVDIGGGNGNYTQAQARLDVFGTGAGDASLKQWFLENSYGRQDITGDVVTGLSFPMTGCNYTELTSALRTQVNDKLGMTPNIYLWQFLSHNSSCGWSGVASVGTAMTPRLDTWLNASAGCTVLAQEPMHNFGMQHSSSLRCGNTTFANDPSSCTHSEYGDPFDPLGGGCRHTNAWQKAYQGWFLGCNRVRVNQSGAFNLLPFEIECNGIQVLQVPMPVTTRTVSRSGGGGQASNDPVQFYYLELRTRSGFDEGMTNAPVVLVHIGPDFRARNITGMHTWILDMNPSTNGFDGMSVGQTFTDPAGGVSFTVRSASASGATVDVTVPTNTPSTCTDGGVLPSPGGATTCNGGVGAGGGAGTGGAGRSGSGGANGNAGRGGAAAGGRNGAGAGGGNGGGLGGASAAAGAGGFAGSGMSGSAGSGVGGSAGVAGAPSAGSTGTGGAGGFPDAGAAGAPSGGSSDNGGDDPGCGCRVPTARNENEGTLRWGLLGALAAFRVRRRKRVSVRLAAG